MHLNLIDKLSSPSLVKSNVTLVYSECGGGKPQVIASEFKNFFLINKTASTRVYENWKFQRTSKVQVIWKREISKNEQAGSGYLKTGTFKERTSGLRVFENGKFRGTNKWGPGIWKTGNFKEQAGSRFMKTGNFKEQAESKF